MHGCLMTLGRIKASAAVMRVCTLLIVGSCSLWWGRDSRQGPQGCQSHIPKLCGVFILQLLAKVCSFTAAYWSISTFVCAFGLFPSWSTGMSEWLPQGKYSCVSTILPLEILSFCTVRRRKKSSAHSGSCHTMWHMC